MVKKWVDLYKRHRAILDSDIIHLRRPDGRDLDGFLHVNPEGSPRGLAVFHNPTGQVMEKTMAVPLYYTGLDGLARVREQDGTSVPYNLDRDHKIYLTVRIAPHGRTWFIIEAPEIAP